MCGAHVAIFGSASRHGGAFVHHHLRDLCPREHDLATPRRPWSQAGHLADCALQHAVAGSLTELVSSALTAALSTRLQPGLPPACDQRVRVARTRRALLFGRSCTSSDSWASGPFATLQGLVPSPRGLPCWTASPGLSSRAACWTARPRSFSSRASCWMTDDVVEPVPLSRRRAPRSSCPS